MKITPLGPDTYQLELGAEVFVFAVPSGPALPKFVRFLQELHGVQTPAGIDRAALATRGFRLEELDGGREARILFDGQPVATVRRTDPGQGFESLFGRAPV